MIKMSKCDRNLERLIKTGCMILLFSGVTAA